MNDPMDYVVGTDQYGQPVMASEYFGNPAEFGLANVLQNTARVIAKKVPPGMVARGGKKIPPGIGKKVLPGMGKKTLPPGIFKRKGVPPVMGRKGLVT